MSADQLAQQVAGELEGDYGHELGQQIRREVSVNSNNTRSLLNISAEVATIESFLFSVCCFAWEKYKTIKDRSDMEKILESEFETIPDISSEERKKIIKKVVDTLY